MVVPYVFVCTSSAIQASLPVAKLCALVTMQGPRGAGGSNIQDFTLPLKLVADSKVSEYCTYTPLITIYRIASIFHKGKCLPKLFTFIMLFTKMVKVIASYK